MKTAAEYSKARYLREKEDPVLYAQLQERRKRSRAKLKEKNPNYHTEYRTENSAKIQEGWKKRKSERPWIHACSRAKQRAKERGLDFDIDFEYVRSIWNDVCPILGIPLLLAEGRANDCSPSLDRIDPERGYVKGNVVVISQRANVIKNCGTLEEHRMIVNFLESQHTSQGPAIQDPDCQQSLKLESTIAG